ncbi:MAG: hypothetical protein MI747_13310 [Desulfobacterales bacterium]|nr:hypothetical protein [Desulfobacterales bacterium]
MTPSDIRDKFGDDYQADADSFIMGIDQRFTRHFAQRFQGLNVLETCTGAGFTTLSLARTARHVHTVEIDDTRRDMARANLDRAGLSHRITFWPGSIMDPELRTSLPRVDAAFMDPDWAVTGPDHIYRFQGSNTRPPADLLLAAMMDLTENLALVLPPFIDPGELASLPGHERESLFLEGSHELFCLYFGGLKARVGPTAFHVNS